MSTSSTASVERARLSTLALSLVVLASLSAVARADEGGERAATDAAAAPHAALPEEGEAAAPAWPDRVGPFELATPDGAARLRIGLLSQLQLQIGDRELADGARQTDVDLLVQRIRPTFAASFLDGRISSALTLDVAPGKLELIDLFVDVMIIPELRVRVGQLKVPFTMYWQQPLTQLATVDWPLTSRWFGGERQLGLMLHDTRADPAGFSYAFGVFAGENRRGAYARELPGAYGETHGNPSSLVDPRPPERLHPELVGRLTHSAAGSRPDTFFDERGGGLRHSVSLSAAWDTDPTYRRDFLLRIAPEVLLKWNGFSWSAVGFVGFTETLDESIIPAAVGFLTELGWQADPHLQIAARYSRVHVLPELSADTRAYAASLEPVDPELHDGWQTQYGGVGHLQARHELALAVTVPIIGRSLAWQTDVAWLRTERDDGDRDDFRARTQIQLAF